jgi:hypothetical protein
MAFIDVLLCFVCFSVICNYLYALTMTEGIQTFANYRQTYKAKHYINSLKHVNEVLKLAQENKKP